MKNILFTLTFSLSFIAFSQTKQSSKTKQQFQFLSSKIENQIITKNWVKLNLSKFPIYKVNGEFCLSTVAKANNNFTKEDLQGKFYLGSQVGNIVTIKIPLKNITPNLTISNIEYIEVSARIQKLNNKMTRDLRVDSVRNWANLNHRFSGKNVLIGITDWGFDYDHPMFMDTTLSNSRVRAAWDQFKLSGPHPSGMSYGTEHDTPTELANSHSDTASTYYDYATHGSHVAGIAGGSGAGLKYRGVAYESQFLFNSIQLDVGSAIDAFTWMKSIADADGKRLVINMSWGLYYLGTMDGTSLVSQAINTLSDQAVVFVTSAGNNGDENLHIKKQFSNDSIRTRIGFYPYSAHASMWGQCISMWGEPNKPFSAQLEIYNSSNVKIGVSKIYNTALDNGYYDTTLVINSDTIFYNYTIDSAHALNQRARIQLKVKNTNTSLRVVLNSFAPTGKVHYWNVVELSNGVGNWGLPFYAFGNNGVTGDSHYTLGEPSCTENTITVAAHNSENVSVVGNRFPGGLANFSSEGPTYDERMKPDVSAPGMNVISSINSYTTRSYTSVESTVFNGRTYHFAAFSGTSMSSPATAGVVALMLEANPSLAPSQVRSILKSTARQDSRTGVIPVTGSTEWGFGKVTATAAIQLAMNTVNVSELETKTAVSIFPNPSSNELNIKFERETNNLIKIEIISLDGKINFRKDLKNSLKLDVSNWIDGTYFIKIKESKSVTVMKFVKIS